MKGMKGLEREGRRETSEERKRRKIKGLINYKNNKHRTIKR